MTTESNQTPPELPASEGAITAPTHQIPPIPRAPVPASPKKAMVFEPMPGNPGFGSIIEALLKRPGTLLYELNGEHAKGIIGRLVIIALICTAIYGVVMGSLSGGSQLWAAPLKLTLGTAFSVLICLPSLYIFLCLSGADLRIKQVCGALAGMITLLSLLLIGFAPVAWVFSQSTDSVVVMGIMHLLFWIIGLVFGQRILTGLLGYSGVSNHTHLNVWTIIFIFVAMQMTAVLRPLIGTSETLLPDGKIFFLTHWLNCL